MKIYNNILETIGSTPLVRLNRMTRGIKGTVVVKLESKNPGGSVKDRIGVHMVDEAERTGRLKPGGTIIENTSGNTGLGLALTAAVRGYKAIFTMPDKVSAEKSSLLRAFGAEVILCPTAVTPEDPRSYYSVAKRLSIEISNSFYPNQYTNPMNPDAHYRTTGPEIWQDTDGKVTHVVAGMGTGGTITGISKYLKERNPKVRVIGVDPVGSIYTGFFRDGTMVGAKTYKIEGVGEDFMPTTIDFKYIDDVVQVGDREGFRTARRMSREEAVFTGSSGGMCMYGALQVMPQLKDGDLMVVLIPDTGERYLSKVYNEDWLRENQLIEPGILFTAREIVARKQDRHEQLITVAADSTVKEVVNVMREKDLSQVPVVDGGKLVGSVRESGVIELLLKGDKATSRKIREVMEKPFPIVDESADAECIYDLLSQGSPAVLVPSGENNYQIITKWDLIHSISGKR